MAKRMIIIEDSVTTLSILKELFEDRGYDVLTAETGKDGVNTAGENKPDLALIDTLLPDTDGFAVCEKIRKNDPNIKIVVMTGSIDAIDAMKAREAGADEYTVKTGDNELLIEVVEKLMG